ncbi:MAG: flavodoxin family protein [Candidatus Gastranaerophilaceae bacterium]
MDRRNFIKNSIIASVALTAGVIAGTSVFSNSDLKNGKENKMKILILTGSPRKNGNSNTLVDNFIKGAKENGHEIVRFDSAFKKVHPCMACNHCGMNGDCVYKDDFEFVKENIIDADMVVFATPMYYFGISAQLKAVIDRFYSINEKIHKPKKSALFMTYADRSAKIAEPIKNHYEVLLNYLGWTNVGEIIAEGVWQAGSVNSTQYPNAAYELGKNL